MGQKGFSLMEVVMAVLLLVAVSGGLFTAFIAASHWTEPEVNTGFNIARQKIEALYTQVAHNRKDLAESLRGKSDAEGYHSEISVNDVTDEEKDYKKVEVTVQLPD